ncbi:glycosyltransferase [Desulfonatronospira sp.]|uniref:glycosyltransferase n=1 Tax=Desulfonatronospira sp. TaxID=1962951 RepID=UPI0025BF98CD|nr:glycosyltransferase [Desulfonatronospira sp.]
MKICMFTNTYLPHVGGVARSVDFFARDMRKMGHEVLVIAPTFPGLSPGVEEEGRVVRVPALQNFNGSDFSVRLPLPFTINRQLERFRPDIIHSHHPYLMGDSALRMAMQHDLPLVFTHHTLYERYTHYVPLNSEKMQRFVIELSTKYADMCSMVVAPSESIALMLEQRGVNAPIEVIPTGVDLDFFAAGDGTAFKEEFGMQNDRLVIGHVGRLAPEKNLEYLSRAVAFYLKKDPGAVFLVVGEGPSREAVQEILQSEGVLNRLITAGQQSGQRLADAYRAMDVFVFSSTTETQGMVLAEAMAAGNPVIALDASGVREVVRDGENGRLLDARSSEHEFAEAIKAFARDKSKQEEWRQNALKTACTFSRESCAGRMAGLYERVIKAFVKKDVRASHELVSWDSVLKGIRAQWQLLSHKTQAAVSALKQDGGHR